MLSPVKWLLLLYQSHTSVADSLIISILGSAFAFDNKRLRLENATWTVMESIEYPYHMYVGSRGTEFILTDVHY